MPTKRKAATKALTLRGRGRPPKQRILSSTTVKNTAPKRLTKEEKAAVVAYYTPWLEAKVMATFEGAYERDSNRPHPGRLPESTLHLFSKLVAQGVFVADIAKDHRFPSEPIIWSEIARRNSPLQKAYETGKKAAVARLEEEAMRIALSPTMGEVRIVRDALTRDGDVVQLTEVTTRDAIEYRRLLIDTIFRTLAHYAPRKHRPRVTGLVSVDGEEPSTALKDLVEQFRLRNEQIKNGDAAQSKGGIVEGKLVKEN